MSNNIVFNYNFHVMKVKKNKQLKDYFFTDYSSIHVRHIKSNDDKLL